MTIRDRNRDVLLDKYLKYKGIFSWQDLTRFIRDWLEKNHYTFYELKYKEKPDMYGKEFEWKIKADKKIDGYYQYWIYIFAHAWDMAVVEVVKEGEKIKTNDGRVIIEFDMEIVADYDEQFERSSFHKKMESFLSEHIIKEDLESVQWDSLYYELYRFKNEVEAHLNMETATIGSLYHG